MGRLPTSGKWGKWHLQGLLQIRHGRIRPFHQFHAESFQMPDRRVTSHAKQSANTSCKVVVVNMQRGTKRTRLRLPANCTDPGLHRKKLRINLGGYPSDGCPLVSHPSCRPFRIPFVPSLLEGSAGNTTSYQSTGLRQEFDSRHRPFADTTDTRETIGRWRIGIGPFSHLALAVFTRPPRAVLSVLAIVGKSIGRFRKTASATDGELIEGYASIGMHKSYLSCATARAVASSAGPLNCVDFSTNERSHPMSGTRRAGVL